MKKKVINFFVVVFTFLTCHTASAQKESNQLVITTGMGYSISQSLIKKVLSTDLSESEELKSIPLLNLMVDYGISDQFSLGVAYTFNQFAWEESDVNESLTSISFTRHNIAGRGLFHFGRNDDLDLYTGLRMGTTIWDISSEGNDYDDNSDFSVLSGLSAQGLFGVRAYFSDVIGVNFEAGLGTGPYFCAGGLSFRL